MDTVSQQQYAELLRENAKLKKINQVLMNRVEQGLGNESEAYETFATSALLADKVKRRTAELHVALEEISKTNEVLKAERSISERDRQRLSDAIESISDAFVLLDSERTVVLANSRFYSFWSNTSVVIVPGKTTLQDINVLSIEAGIIDVASLQAEKMRVRSDQFDSGLFKLRDGRWIQTAERPTGDGGLVLIYTDVTTIKRAEIALREQAVAKQAEIMQAALINLQDGLAIVDENFCIKAWNPRFTELTGISHISVDMSLTSELSKSEMRKLLPVGRFQAGEYQVDIELPDGKALLLKRVAVEGLGYVLSIFDITDRTRTARELKRAHDNLELRVQNRTRELFEANIRLQRENTERRQAEERIAQALHEADQANKSKSKFIAATSHDLLQPLNAANLYASALNEEDLGAKANRLVDSLAFSLHSVEKLIGSLVDISKLEAGLIVAAKEDFCINELLSKIANDYILQTDELGLEFRFHPMTFPVHSDPLLLARVVRNFLSNAMRYAKGGKILLGCRRRGSTVEVFVKDTGPGIPEDKLQVIFEEFTRLPQQTASQDRGLGLGLAIVDKISKILQHELRVTSRLGFGSSFAIRVPVSQLDTAICNPLADSKRREMVAEPFDGLTVLVIDNESYILDAMENLLSGWGCDIALASGREEALCAVKSAGCYDLVIVDYHLDNDENGLDLANELQKHSTLRLPVLMITANYTSELRKDVREQGYELLNKPVNPIRLRSMMNHLINQ